MSKVAVICGSLRKASTNAGILRAIIEKKDPDFQFIYVDIHDFPLFNEDVEALGIPAPVQKARDLIKSCDAVLFGVPEYNFSVSSPLKNAYDWLSRDDKNKFCPMTDKIGAFVSSGAAGGSRAQDHFRQIVSFQRMKILEPSKEAAIQIKRFSGQFFDSEGNLTDKNIKEKTIPLFLQEFKKFIKSKH